jgi:hypothetical protein
MAKRKRMNNDLQNITQNSKDQAARTPQKNGNELRCSRRLSSSCSTSGTCHVTLIANPVICHEREKDRILIMTNGTYV